MKIKLIISCFVILFGGMHFYSCSKQKMVDRIVTDVEKSYTSEALLKGIFFGQGEIAEKISFYKTQKSKHQFSQKEEEEYVLFVNQAVEDFYLTDTTYSKMLHDALVSKDVLKIDTALKRGNEIFNQIIKTENNNLTPSINQGKCLYGPVAVAYVVAAAAAAVYAAVYAWTYYWRGLDEEHLSLEKEIFISDLANLYPITN